MLLCFKMNDKIEDKPAPTDAVLKVLCYGVYCTGVHTAIPTPAIPTPIILTPLRHSLEGNERRE